MVNFFYPNSSLGSGRSNRDCVKLRLIVAFRVCHSSGKLFWKAAALFAMLSRLLIYGC